MDLLGVLVVLVDLFHIGLVEIWVIYTNFYLALVEIHLLRFMDLTQITIYCLSIHYTFYLLVILGLDLVDSFYT